MLLRQPDPTTCGSCCAVRARMVLDEGYDAWVRADPTGSRFREEALAAHQRTNRSVNALGKPQLPWPLALGTWPWALARELSAVDDVRYLVSPVLPWARADGWQRLVRTVATGRPAPIYVGNALTARHVVLALSGSAGELTVYDPASGTEVPVTRSVWAAGRLGLSGWDVPWFLVLPPLTPAAGAAASGPPTDTPAP